MADAPTSPPSIGRPSTRIASDALPRWPVAWLLAAYPLWWLLGLGEFVWPLAAAIMAALLTTTRRVVVPRGFGIWFLFILWVVASASQVDASDRMAGFLYRLALYASAVVIYIYIYNARRHLQLTYVLGLLVVFFAWVVAGGYLGLAVPTLTVRTPLALVLPEGLLRNELVQQMAVRRVTQYNPAAWSVIDPRPSAPFLYTNNWGNVYSLLVPLVMLYMSRVRGSKNFWLLAVLLPASLVPAFLTLNRGMFVGLSAIALYVAIRFLRHGRTQAIRAVLLLTVVGVVVLQALPVGERLDNRLERSGTNESRLTVYQETIARAATSPLLGFGTPRPAENVSIEIPSLGTQGQVWMVLFSHGFVGAALFLGGLLWFVAATSRRVDVAGIVLNGVLAGVVLESFFYGLLGPGLGVTMIVAGLAMRPSSYRDVGTRSSPDEAMAVPT